MQTCFDLKKFKIYPFEEPVIMLIHKLQQFPKSPFIFFDKIKVILYLQVKFMFSKKATELDDIFIVDLTLTT